MVPRLRAAANAGQPPLRFILEDPDHEWDRWDFRLAKAYELYMDLSAGGMPIYWDRSDRVVMEVESYVSKSKAALDRAEEKASKSKTKNYGKVFYAVPRTKDDGPLPTLEEYLEEQREKRALMAGKFRIKPGAQFDNSGWVAPEVD